MQSSQSVGTILIQALLPKLSYYMHKGQNGKVGVIGGSKDYTGAPFYSGLAALRSGADIAHIFCTEDAAGPIKGYSPELIVHPCLERAQEVGKWLGGSVNSLVIGPGIGREESGAENLLNLTKIIGESGLPLIGDADFLWYLSSSQ